MLLGRVAWLGLHVHLTTRGHLLGVSWLLTIHLLGVVTILRRLLGVSRGCLWLLRGVGVVAHGHGGVGLVGHGHRGLSGVGKGPRGS